MEKPRKLLWPEPVVSGKPHTPISASRSMVDKCSNALQYRQPMMSSIVAELCLVSTLPPHPNCKPYSPRHRSVDHYLSTSSSRHGIQLYRRSPPIACSHERVALGYPRLNFKCSLCPALIFSCTPAKTPGHSFPPSHTNSSDREGQVPSKLSRSVHNAQFRFPIRPI